jgi:hypothetical protein
MKVAALTIDGFKAFITAKTYLVLKIVSMSTSGTQLPGTSNLPLTAS